MEISFTIPSTTTGMGNPTLPTDTEFGSGDTLVTGEEHKLKPKKKMKHLKDYLKNKKK